MRDHTHIIPELIFAYESDFKKIVFFYYIKSKFHTPIIYNYTPKKLSKLLNNQFSENIIRKYIGYLKQEGLCEYRDGHLKFLGLRKTHKRIKSTRITIDTMPWTTWRQFYHRVMAKLIRYNQLQQEFMYLCKSAYNGVNKSVPVKMLNRFNKKYRKHFKASVGCMPVCNSTRQIGKLFSRSKSWGNKLIVELDKMGYIKKKFLIEKLDEEIPAKFLGLSSNYLYNHKGCTYSHSGMRIYILI